MSAVRGPLSRLVDRLLMISGLMLSGKQSASEVFTLTVAALGYLVSLDNSPFR